jgi:hypothetical protein
VKFKSKSDKNRNIKINLGLINTYVSRYLPGTEFEIEIVRRKRKKSDPLRKYFYGVVLPLFCDAYGYDAEERLTVHKHCKCLYFSVEPDKHGVYRDRDVPALFGDDTEKDNQVKLKYIKWMQRKAAEAGVYIPDPNE